MALIVPLNQDAPCRCGFVLWQPIAQSEYSSLGLYDDARFPGRSILRLNEHQDSLERVPTSTLMGFMQDIQAAIAAIRGATGAARVNVAILGNRDPHVHAHLVPRFPLTEQFPDCSPWNDLRRKTSLTDTARTEIMGSILEALKRQPA